LLAVVGPRGIGKSEVLLRALSYLIEREQLDCSRVVYINAKNYRSSTEAVFALLERLGINFGPKISSSNDALKFEEAKYELEVLLRHLQGQSQKYMVFAFDNLDSLGDNVALADLVRSLTCAFFLC
jgi:Cdc6-like AAA superfamily ATPase